MTLSYRGLGGVLLRRGERDRERLRGDGLRRLGEGERRRGEGDLRRGEGERRRGEGLLLRPTGLRDLKGGFVSKINGIETF